MKTEMEIISTMVSMTQVRTAAKLILSDLQILMDSPETRAALLVMLLTATCKANGLDPSRHLALVHSLVEINGKAPEEQG